MHYKNSKIFRLLSITVVIAHFFVFTLQDLCYASESNVASINSNSSKNTTSSNSSSGPAPTSQATSHSKGSDSERDSGFEPPDSAVFQNLNIPNLSQNFQTDLYTGKATFSYPIEVPPGRAGIEPKINLTYSSYDNNNWCGILPCLLNKGCIL